MFVSDLGDEVYRAQGRLDLLAQDVPDDPCVGDVDEARRDAFGDRLDARLRVGDDLDPDALRGLAVDQAALLLLDLDLSGRSAGSADRRLESHGKHQCRSVSAQVLEFT